MSQIPRLARQDLAAGFAGALPGLRLAPHIVKHTCGATQKNAHIENHTPHHTHKGGALAALAPTTVPMWAAAAAPIGTVVLPFMCVVWCVVFYVSVLLCGAACVLDDVRRKAQAGQRTRKARSQVLPCKPRYSAYACWLRKDLQEKSTLPKKDVILMNFGYNFNILFIKNA